MIDPTQASTKDLRSFGLIFAALLCVFFGLLIPWIWSFASPRWPWIVGGVFAILALAAPAALRPAYIVWMKIGAVLGWINTRILLGVVFFGMCLPFGIVMRIFRRDPMSRKLDSESESYRITSKQPDHNNLERPF